ncbi:MAG: hypothetical protein INR71_00525, partial [Terriglobus roseus]|nr:hypothetical protein [Terriglobus roseus]
MSPRSTRTRRVRATGEENLHPHQHQHHRRRRERDTSTPLSNSQQRPLANFTELSSENILEGSQKRPRNVAYWSEDYSGDDSLPESPFASASAADDDDQDEGSEILVRAPSPPITASLLGRARRVLVVHGLNAAHWFELDFPRYRRTLNLSKRPAADFDAAADSGDGPRVKRRKTSEDGAASANHSSEHRTEDGEDADDADDDPEIDSDEAKRSDVAGQDVDEQQSVQPDDALDDEPKVEVAKPPPKPATRGRGGRRGGRWGRGGRGSKRGANLRRTASQNPVVANGDDETPGQSPYEWGWSGGPPSQLPDDEIPDVEALDVITDADLPSPFLVRPPTPPRDQCTDEADWLLRKQYAPMTDPQAFIMALTKLPPAARSTENLYRLALNTQKALAAWQDQFLLLDARTAPHSNPPKKPANGGRVPLDSTVWEDMKEAELYNYKYDPKKPPGEQDPFAQRLDSELVGGRELRIRRQRDVGDIGTDDDDAQLSATATGPGAALAAGERRKRKTTQRFENTIETKLRKRNLEPTPDPVDGVKRRRGRPPAVEKPAAPTAAGLLAVPPRLSEVIRESSIATTASDEVEPGPEEVSPGPTKHRGRPVGIKNSRPRSDKGIKKGPRNLSKSPLLAAVNNSNTNNAPPPALPPTAAPAPALVVNNVSDPFVVETPKFTGPDRTFVDSRPPQMAQADDRDVPRFDAGARTQMPPPADTSRPPKMPIGPTGAQPPTGEPKRKQRVKSEKRSQSMTLWWASRKAAQEEKRRKEQQEERERWEAQQVRAQEEQRRHAVEQHEARMHAPPHEQPPMPPQPLVLQPPPSYGAPRPAGPPPPPPPYPYAMYAPQNPAPPPSGLPPPPPHAVGPVPPPGTAAQPMQQTSMAPIQTVEHPRPPPEQPSDFARHGGYHAWNAGPPPPRRWESGGFGRISIPDIASSSRSGAGSPSTARSPVSGPHTSILPSPSTRTFQVSMPPANAVPPPYGPPPPPPVPAMPTHASQQSPPMNPLPQPTFNVDMHSKKPPRGAGKFQVLQPKPADAVAAATSHGAASSSAPAHPEIPPPHSMPPAPLGSIPPPPQGLGPVLAPAPSSPAVTTASALPPPPSTVPHQHQIFHPYHHQLPPQHRPPLGAPFEPLPYQPQPHSVPPPPPPAPSTGPTTHQRRDSGPRRRHTPSFSSTSQSWQPLTTMQIQTHAPPSSTIAQPSMRSPVGQMFDPVSGVMRDRRPSESRMRVQEGQGQSPTIRTNPTRFQNYDVESIAQSRAVGGSITNAAGGASQPHSRRPSQSSTHRPGTADAMAAEQRRSQSVDLARSGIHAGSPAAGTPATVVPPAGVSQTPHPPPQPQPFQAPNTSSSLPTPQPPPAANATAANALATS